MGTPIPQRLYDRAELLARSHPLGTVAEIMGIGRTTVSKMKKRGWKAVDYSSLRRPVPTDWAWRAPDMSVNELAAYYGTCSRTVCRWLREKPVRPLWRKSTRRPRG
jgi:hypothetical protein